MMERHCRNDATKIRNNNNNCRMMFIMKAYEKYPRLVLNQENIK